MSDNLGKKVWDASRNADDSELRQLLARGAPVNWKSGWGSTPLHEACAFNHPSHVGQLLTRSPDINAVDDYGRTPLHDACSSGGTNCVRLLMNTRKCNLRVFNKPWGRSPLGWAIYHRELDCVRVLLNEYHVDSDAPVTESGLTPLGLAASEDKYDVVLYLIEKCQVNISDLPVGKELLAFTIRGGHLQFIKRLSVEIDLDITAPVTPSGLTPLGLAVREGKIEIIEWLIEEYKSDINAPVTESGLTPLGLAVRDEKLNMIKYLMEECKVDVNDPSLLKTFLELAVLRSDLQFIKHLVIERGVDVSAPITQLESGLTPLGLAISRGEVDVIKYLFEEYKIDVNASITQLELTPLGLAISKEKLNVIRCLVLDCKANVEAPVAQSGFTPLRGAVISGHVSVIKCLVERCKAKVTGEHLLLASQHHRSDVVKYLLSKAKCNPNYKNDAGQTALMFFSDDPEMIKYLLKHGAHSEEVYTSYRKQLGNLYSKDPLVNPVKIFTIGNSGEGKSSVIKSMQDEPKLLTSLKNAFTKKKEIEGVNQLTAGIQPFYFNSSQYGLVLFYDFAGQEIYYNSHAAVFKAAVTTCPPIFQFVIGLHNDDATNSQSVSYWLKMIEDQCPQMEGKAPLIFIASHFDMVDQAEFERKKKIIVEAANKFDKFEVIDVVPMDCRYSNSDGMKTLRRHIGTCCQSIRQRLSVSLNCQIFQLFLIENYSQEISVSLKRVKSDLSLENLKFKTDVKNMSKKLWKARSLIPHEDHRLVEICTQLSDKGHILFLHNRKLPGESFIIIDKAALLANINGGMFAPEHFKEFTPLATSTGVVPQSKLAAKFSQYDIDLIIGFLSHLELAMLIEDSQVLEGIQDHQATTGESTDERFVFCPGLIKLEVPSGVFQHRQELPYHSGWILHCSGSEDFFTPRLTCVLILRLALSLGIAPIIDETIPAIQQHCSVWKTGVCWSSTDCGATILVEVVNKKMVLVLIQAPEVSPDLQKLQSTVMQKVVEATKEFCPSVVTEAMLVSPACVTYPLDPNAVLFSLKSVAESIASKNRYVISTTGTKTILVSDLDPLGFVQEKNQQELTTDNNLPEFSRYSPSSAVSATDYQLDTEITELDLQLLAGCFDHYNNYVHTLGLTEAQQADLTRTEFLERSAESGMREALRIWRRRDPSAATFRELLRLVKSLGKSQVAQNILDYIKENIVSSK